MGKAPRRKAIRQAREGESSAAKPGKPKKRQEKDVLPLLQQLDAESADERTWACASLSLLLSESEMQTRRLVASHKVVDLLIGKSNAQGSESDVGVRTEALGALRNYAVECGQEVCAEMFNKGLLPVLLAYIPLLSSVISNLDVGGMQADLPRDIDAQRRIVWDTTENVLTLIWCLAESAPKALPTLSSSDGLAPFLLNILSLHHTNVKLSPTLPTSVVATALQTLSCLTDSNPTFALPFLHLDLDALLSIAQSIASAKEGRNSSKQLLRVLAISCLLNIIHCTSMPVPAAMLPFDDPKEAKRLQKRHTRLADQLKHALDFKALETLVQGLQVDLNSLADEEEIQNLQIQLEVLGQFALSMDGLATLEEEDEWRGIEAEGDDSAEDVSDVDDAMDDAVLEQLDVDMNGDGDQEPEDAEPGSMIPTSMGSVILDSNLVPTLLAFGAPSTIVPAINGQASIISTAQNGTKSTADQLRDLCRLRAMEALNNLLFTCTRAHLASRPGSNSTFLPAPVLQSTWEALFQLLATHANSHLADYRLAVLGCVLACAQIAQNSLAIGSGETPFLLQVVGSAEEDADVRARAISVLALLGARESVSVPENETIGTTLITPFKAPTADSLKKEMTVLTQALDSLIDLYSDETRDFDRVFREQNFQHKLKKVIPTFKVAVKAIDKRKHPEQRFRADAVLTNLIAFTKYRDTLRL